MHRLVVAGLLLAALALGLCGCGSGRPTEPVTVTRTNMLERLPKAGKTATRQLRH